MWTVSVGAIVYPYESHTYTLAKTERFRFARKLLFDIEPLHTYA